MTVALRDQPGSAAGPPHFKYSPILGVCPYCCMWSQLRSGIWKTSRGPRAEGSGAYCLRRYTWTMRRLLDRYEIQTHLISYHEFNENSCSGPERLLMRLNQGDTGRLVSDGWYAAARPFWDSCIVHAAARACGGGAAGSARRCWRRSWCRVPADRSVPIFAGFLPAEHGQRTCLLNRRHSSSMKRRTAFSKRWRISRKCWLMLGERVCA